MHRQIIGTRKTEHRRLIPWIGSLIWMAKVQGKLNDFWEGQEIRSTAGAPPVTV